ncbi:MAG: hypothetical protein IJY39_07840 [Clostridia bacterium]|nr:hypothetical protein [Clostridia bacterium]
MKRIVLIFGFFAGGTALFMAVETGFAPSAVVASLSEHAEMEVILSERAIQLTAEAACGEKVYTDAREYLKTLFDRLSVLQALANHRGKADTQLILRSAEQAAALIGVHLESTCNCNGENAASESETATVFDGAVCTAVIMIMTAVVSDPPGDGVLYLDLFEDEVYYYAMRIRVRCADKTMLDATLDNLHRAIMSCHNFAFDVIEDGEEVCLWVSPIYLDVGLTGVKRKPLYLRYNSIPSGADSAKKNN